VSDPVITVERLSKRYVLDRQRTRGEGLRHKIERAVRAPFSRLRQGAGGPRPATEEFWALRDVSLDVQPGEVVGIIGRNGAGKSTLLKILSRITEPTTGRIRLKGRIASLLEVGTGFHPELTGRENIFLNGAILGMTRAEIRSKFDDIVGFAEVQRFIDTPVKRYSSGMYVRLAFSVAAHLQPDILIVDEVLAVGDVQFQKKCLGKMHDVSRQQGRTVLFVSHNMQAVSTLTTRAVLLREGRCVLQGPTDQVIAGYLEETVTAAPVYSAPPQADAPSVTRVEIETSEPNNTHVHGKPIRVTIDVTTPEPIRSATLCFYFVDPLLKAIAQFMVFDTERPFCRAAGTYRLTCEIPRLRLYLGRYAISVHLSEGYGGRHIQSVEGVCAFEMVMHGHEREWPWQDGACYYLEDAQWRVAPVAGAPASRPVAADETAAIGAI
jgi:lipopolysaccharide transport system ATP-binding protein